ncbi:MAG: hypothetical protein QN172_08640 [Armatimonadota bacterium]|nr:hypothetical protein [Armatimonadota bacterium]
MRIHGTTHERPVDRWQREWRSLRSLPPLPVVLARTEVHQVAWDGTFSWNRTRYSVPVAYVGQPVLVRELESGELVVEAAGEIILRCPVSRERFGVRIDPAHYAGLSRQIPRPHRRLLGIQQAPR